MFVPFSNWLDVLFAAETGVPLFYHAPLDTAPRPVLVRKRFKNGKLRLDAGEVVFTADSGHLSRLFRRRTAADVTMAALVADALRVQSSEPGQTIDMGDSVIETTLHRLG